ncbi:MAG TPA: YchJ family metal-binding protein [Chlamydiales bacterium]|nr:YchJ family metal-binding protein [Chlamydiales bacterium]
MNCPCCSGKKYSDCCKPYHDGASPPTPLALMRSRYSAYSFDNAGYIMRTTHPKSPYFEKDRKKWEVAIHEFCRTTQFEKLEIVGSGDGWVHFIAHLRQKGPLLLEEKSQFERVDGHWLYLKGDFTKN